MSNSSRPNIHLCLISVEVSYFWSTHTHTLTHILTHTHTHILMSLAHRLIEIWTWIIHAWLMSLGSLLTMNSRRVDLDVCRMIPVCFDRCWRENAPYCAWIFLFYLFIFFLNFIVRQNNTRKTKAMATGQLKQTCQGIRENKVGVSCCRSS